jgi:hypothetical protein
MTKKDYTIIAHSIATTIEKSTSDLDTMNDLVDQISLDLLRDNPRFRSDLFVKEIYHYAHSLSFSLYRDRKDPRVDSIIQV